MIIVMKPTVATSTAIISQYEILTAALLTADCGRVRFWPAPNFKIVEQKGVIVCSLFLLII